MMEEISFLKFIYFRTEGPKLINFVSVSILETYFPYHM